MIEKILEWGAKAITTLLFVVSVTLFVIIFVVDPFGNASRAGDLPADIRPTAVEEIEIVEPEITNLVDTKVIVKDPVLADGNNVEEPEVEEIKVIEEANVTVEEVVPDQAEVELLAKVIYQEAGGDECCDECRRRVADVVLNRVADSRYPDTILEVLSEKSQYGRYHWTGVIWPEKANYESEKHAVERAYRIAEEVLSGQHSELYGQNYIWQAEFVQGYDNVICCGMYFGKG